MKKYRKAFLISAAALAFVSLTACASKTSEEAGTPESASQTLSVTESASADVTEALPEETTETLPEETSKENNEELSYMEKYADIIEKELPGEIEKKRDGMNYPEFKKYQYYSTTAERDTNVNVLLPSDYSEDKEYPVLYILHGYYDNEDWMARPIVSISAMLSNLCADGKAKEMIVVVPYIYCSKDMPYCTGMDLTNSLNYDNFINDLTTDLMPFIESIFSVAKGRENTAITGFSMGGRESLFIGFSHPELFGYIGAVCPAPGLTPVANSPMHPGQMEESELTFSDDSPYMLLISAAENDGVVGSFPASYHNMLNANETEHLWHTTSRGGHDHSSVKPHLYNFLRVIFQNTAESE